jgi:hypothetical protein
VLHAVSWQTWDLQAHAESAGYVQDSVGALRRLPQRLDGLGGRQDHQLDLVSRGLPLHFSHNWQVAVDALAA